MNPDYADMLFALSDAGAEHLVVGAHALAAHGHVRATGDLDIWVRSTPENAARVQVPLGEHVVPVLGFDDLVTNKRATGRPQDIADVAALLQMRPR